MLAVVRRVGCGYGPLCRFEEVKFMVFIFFCNTVNVVYGYENVITPIFTTLQVNFSHLAWRLFCAPLANVSVSGRVA